MRVKSERKEEKDNDSEEEEEKRPEQSTERKELPRVKIEPWRPPERTTARKTPNSRPPHLSAYITLDDDHEEEETNDIKEAVQSTQRQRDEVNQDSTRDCKDSGRERSRREEEKEDRRREAVEADEQGKREKLREMKEQEKRRREEKESIDDDGSSDDRRRENSMGEEKVREDPQPNVARKRPGAASTATATRKEPPRKEKPVDLSKMTKTERREYLQKQNNTRAVRREDSAERKKENAAPSRKQTADRNLKPTRQRRATGAAHKRKRDDDYTESADDEEEEQYADVLQESPLTPRRTRGSDNTAAGSSKPTEDRLLESISDEHAIPPTFASVRGGEDKGKKEDLCCVCFYGYGFGDADAPEDQQDNLMVCSSCRMNIHESCYGVSASKLPDDWVCKLCEAGVQGQVRCALCRQTTTEARKGAFKPVQEESRLKRDRGAWAHIACALWVSGCGFAAVGDDSRAAVTGIEYLSEELYNKSTTCALCNNRDGVKMKCFNTHCEIHFHPLCGLRHEWIEDFFYYLDGEYVTHQDYEYRDDHKIHKPYCKWHDPSDRHGLRSREQRRKTKEEEEEEVRQEAEMKRRAEARKKQRLDQSATERVIRRQDEELGAVEEKDDGRREEKSRKKLEYDSMAEQSRKALQKVRDQQQLRTVNNAASLTQDRYPSPARSTSPAADSLAVGREKARSLLTEHVGKKRAMEIEEELHRAHQPDLDRSLPASQLPLVLSSSYKQKLQSVLSNLRHNGQLCDDVLEKKITPAQLIAMDEQHMADERLRAEREDAKMEDTQEHIRRNEVRTVRRLDGEIVQVREDTLEEVKEQQGNDDSLADGGDKEVEERNDENDSADGDVVIELSNGHSRADQFLTEARDDLEDWRMQQQQQQLENVGGSG